MTTFYRRIVRWLARREIEQMATEIRKLRWQLDIRKRVIVRLNRRRAP